MRAELMRNRLAHVPDEVFTAALAFADAHPDVIAPWHMLQKLVIFDFVVPLLAGDSDILEIGAGLGVHSALLSRFGRVCATELAAPGSFVGADSPVDQGRAAVFAELADGPIRFDYNDGKHLPYPDRSFDVVFHNSVIEHVPDPVAFNREVVRVLRPGGITICITGTPALCRFRFVKDYLLALPRRVAVAVIAELVPRAWYAAAARRGLAAVGANVDRALARLRPADERLAALAPVRANGASRGVPMHELASRLTHYLNAPAYNHLVIEEAARELGISEQDLVDGVYAYLQSPLHRLRFALEPPTHGQHYKNFRHELDEWHIARWRETFTAAGLAVDEIRGYRFHHVLEALPRPSWNARLYHRAAPWIRAVGDALPPSLASEIIIVASRPA